ncbi:cwf21 domain-containing protein [Aspergillus heterothallicus]
MSSNVGLSTPRGSGTSGYVQKNHAFLKPRNFGSGAPYPPPSASKDFGSGDTAGGGFKHRQPDKAILEHEAKRQIEVKVLEERERLEEENEEVEEGKKEGEVLSEEEIDKRCDELREKLVKELEEGKVRGGRDAGRDRRKGFKTYQVHEAAEAKIRESERFKRALGIRDGDSTGGSAERGGSAREEVEKRREREREREREHD